MDNPRRPIVYWFSIATALSALFLIVAGAAVTSTGSGDAVPDWPTSFGGWNPPMRGGVFYEHGHRMIAMFVGLMILVQFVLMFLFKMPKKLKVLSGWALFLVIVQAILGGLRVLVVSNEELQQSAMRLFGVEHIDPVRVGVAVAHACLAQIVLTLTFAMAFISSRFYQELQKGFVFHAKAASPVKRPGLGLGGLIFALIFVQLVVGAVMRHINAGLAIPDFPLSFGQIIPPFGSLPNDPNAPMPVTDRELAFQVAVHFAHRVGGILIAILIFINLLNASKTRSQPGFSTAAWMTGLVIAQICLGAAIIWTEKSVHVTVTHVLIGATLLGLTALYVIQRRSRTEPMTTIATTQKEALA